MPYINQVITLGVMNYSESTQLALSANRFIKWLKECYGDHIINPRILLTSCDLKSDETSNKLDTAVDAVQAIESTTEFCQELDKLAQMVDLYLVPRHVLSSLTPEDYKQLVTALKRVDWVIPPEVEIPAGMIPQFVVVEELIPQVFTALDWGVELARFAEGRLTVLYAANQPPEMPTLNDTEEREYHRRLYDKIAQTDYRTLERGTQLRVFPADVLSALTTIETEYSPWMTVIPQALVNYQDLQALDSKGGMLFLRQTTTSGKTLCGC